MVYHHQYLLNPRLLLTTPPDICSILSPIALFLPWLGGSFLALYCRLSLLPERKLWLLCHGVTRPPLQSSTTAPTIPFHFSLSILAVTPSVLIPGDLNTSEITPRSLHSSNSLLPGILSSTPLFLFTPMLDLFYSQEVKVVYYPTVCISYSITSFQHVSSNSLITAPLELLIRCSYQLFISQLRIPISCLCP